MNKETPILITGADGFIGSHIARRLLQAGYHRLSGLRQADSSFELLAGLENQLSWHAGDLLDYYSLEPALEGVDTLIHCAALVSFDGRDRRLLRQVNRVGTANVVNAALHMGVRRLIHLSTVATLGRQSNGPAVDEETPWQQGDFKNDYALTKALAEQEVWRGQAEGLSVAVLYPTVVLGAGPWDHGSTKIIQYASTPHRYFPSGATGVVDVRDVAEAALRTLERDQDGDRFVLNGHNVTYRRLLHLLAEAFGNPPPHRRLPQALTLLLAWVEHWRSQLTGSRPLLTRASIKQSFRTFRYNNERSCQVLGMAYRPLETTLRESVEIYRETEGKDAGVLPF